MPQETTSSFAADDTAPEDNLVDSNQFIALAQSRLQRILSLCRYLERLPLDKVSLTRPLLGYFLAQCSQAVELLDSYGAKNNNEWHYIRHLCSAGKLFSRVGYIMLHIHHSLSAYQLLCSHDEIEESTKEAVQFNNNVILCLACEIVQEAIRLKIKLPDPMAEHEDFKEELPKGKLPHDRVRRNTLTTEETIAHLSTALLNLAAESELLHVSENLTEEEYPSLFPDPLSEETLRILEQKFHNLQSMYDTYVSDTDTEMMDSDLPYLRGHVSLVFHLLEAATQLCHYYERHLRVRHSENLSHPLVDPDALVKLVVSYLVKYSSIFLKSGVSLCQSMLSRYAQKGSITVPVPKYRGFHVRPSTLVAKICLHYGSKVEMKLNNEVFDAAAPLDLFRANEHINAVKRHKLAEEVSSMNFKEPEVGENITEAVRLIVYALSYRQKVVIYEHPLPIREFAPEDVEGLLFSQVVLNEIARLLAMGKLDIESALEVTFTGDKRVLKDLRILARNGYGEDEFGHNIPLPTELSYLRR